MTCRGRGFKKRVEPQGRGKRSRAGDILAGSLDDGRDELVLHPLKGSLFVDRAVRAGRKDPRY